MNSLSELKSFFPDIWTKALKEEDCLDVLLNLYAMPYASIAAQLTQIANRRSIKTIDYYSYDYYYAIDCSANNVFKPTESVTGYSYCFKIKNGIFYLDKLSYDADLTNPVKNYQILYDAKQDQFFIALRDADYIANQPTALFAEQYHSLNISYHFLEFFKNRPLNSYETPTWTLASNTKNIYVVPANYDELEYVKAQVAALMYCAICGGSPDSLDNLFAIAFRREYAKEDGIVLDFDDTSIWVNHFGVNLRYYTPLLRDKFKVKGAAIRQFEALEKSPVELISWESDPAKFAQLMSGQYASLTRRLVDVAAGEQETSLTLDDVAAKFDEDISSDLGGNLCDYIKTGNRSDLLKLGYSEQEVAEALKTSHYRSSDLWKKIDPNAKPYPSSPGWKAKFEPFIIHYPNAPQNVVLHDYHTWYDDRFGKFAYEMFKNIVIWETRLPAIYHTWIANILTEFKPLHLKYVPSPMNGFICEEAGYGTKYGRYYGGTQCSTKSGYGVNYGRIYGGGSNVIARQPYVDPGYMPDTYVGE